MPFKCFSALSFIFIVEDTTDAPHFVLLPPTVFLKIIVGQKDFLRKRIDVDFNKKNVNI